MRACCCMVTSASAWDTAAKFLHVSMSLCTLLPPQVVSTQLSTDQAAALLRMRKLYLHNLGVLMRRRRELSTVLKVRMLCCYYMPDSEHAKSLWSSSVNHPHQHGQCCLCAARRARPPLPVLVDDSEFCTTPSCTCLWYDAQLRVISTCRQSL